MTQHPSCFSIRDRISSQLASLQASITGHSMGGHGALTIGLKHPELYQSISAFSPISNPMNVPWGQKAFSGYLGDDKETWKQYDATELVSTYTFTQTLVKSVQRQLFLSVPGAWPMTGVTSRIEAVVYGCNRSGSTKGLRETSSSLWGQRTTSWTIS